ncbi:2OG-Fe(II) oxygenase [Paraburkholderia nemoris]|uniref:2OG-Fe(II) oxygenase n=1 Tax=Paraburkholderia nemoris TaxID=2793076 RepID=UPI0038BC6E9B
MNTVAKALHSHSPELELELGFEPKRKHTAALTRCTVTGPLAQRVGAIDWFDVEEELNGYGCAMLRNLLSAQECDALSANYPRDDLYRSRVVMARHGFGRGEYKYFAYPLPQLVAELRAELYPPLAPVANRWNEAMNIAVRYPAAHSEFIERCHAAGQLRPTPLILQYAKDDYNCLHQDLYGEHVFPLQVAILLSEPGQDFTGGEFVMTEQRPRMQSRTEVVPLGKGDAVVFAVHHRPVQGTRGVYRVNLRHGVSRLRSGHRHTLGVIFHDAT